MRLSCWFAADKRFCRPVCQSAPPVLQPTRPSVSESCLLPAILKAHGEFPDDGGCGLPFGQGFQQIGADHDGAAGHSRPGEVVGTPFVLGAPADKPEGRPAVVLQGQGGPGRRCSVARSLCRSETRRR